MNRLDRYFAELGVPVVARQLTAVAEVCFDLGENRPVPDDREPKDECYTGDDLILRAVRWYTSTYEDALRIEELIPPSLIYLRGEHWRVRYPLVFGKALFYAGDIKTGPAVKSGPKGYELVAEDAAERWDTQMPRFDVLTFVVDMPDPVRRLIGKGELGSILTVICKNRLFLHALVEGRHHRYMEEALGNIVASVDYVLKRPPQSGESRWSSLQGVEKALKSFLHHAGRKYPTGGKLGHDLQHLAGLVSDAGGPSFKVEAIAEIACEASVRYDRSSVDSRDAARAHHVAVEVAAVCAIANKQQHPLTKKRGTA